jgi:hypothetical protein
MSFIKNQWRKHRKRTKHTYAREINTDSCDSVDSSDEENIFHDHSQFNTLLNIDDQVDDFQLINSARAVNRYHSLNLNQLKVIVFWNKRSKRYVKSIRLLKPTEEVCVVYQFDRRGNFQRSTSHYMPVFFPHHMRVISIPQLPPSPPAPATASEQMNHSSHNIMELDRKSHR